MADTTQFTKKNHYVPQFYLKQWLSEGGSLWLYRILVSNDNVEIWKPLSSTKGIAYHTHLYTRILPHGQTDEIEKWLDTEYESPAKPIIQKVISESKMSSTDWEILIRFLAAQDVRTPSRLVEMLNRWSNTLPDIMQTTLESCVYELETAKKENRPVKQIRSSHAELMPLNIQVERNPSSDTAFIKAESVAGRGLWLYAIKRLLTTTVEALLHHKWTILKPPKSISWSTSDDPVIKLNYHDSKNYDFKGGWGSKGTDIFFPIGPRHLLYTQVGHKPPRRGTVVSESMAKTFQRLITEHAHRLIFAEKIDHEVESHRPRIVDQAVYNDEVGQWKRWHQENVCAERKLYFLQQKRCPTFRSSGRRESRS